MLEILIGVGCIWGVSVIGVIGQIVWSIRNAPSYEEYGEEHGR
jgi:hypothetical protein